MAESTTRELKIRFQWIPNHQATAGFTIETLPSSLEAPPKPEYLMDVDTGELIHDGYIVTFRMANPSKAPLLSLGLTKSTKCHLVSVLHMASPARGDILERIKSNSRYLIGYYCH